MYQIASRPGYRARIAWGPIQVAVAVLAIAYLAFFLNFAPAIYSADWQWVVGGGWTDTWLDFSLPWPLFKAPFFLQDRILNLDIDAYYVVLSVLHGAQAVLIYMIAGQFSFSHRFSFGLVIALLFLVYPANYTKMWLTMLLIYSSAVLALLYGYHLARFAKGAHPLHLGLALAFLVTSLGIYETHIGLVSAWALILFVLCRKASLGRRLALLGPIALAVLFLLWRTLEFEDDGGKHNFLIDVAATPWDVLPRLVWGYKIGLGYAWTTTLENVLPWLPGTKAAALLLAGTIVVIWLVLRSVMSARRAERADAGTAAWPLDRRWSEIQPFAVCAIIGLLLTAAGYLPAVFQYWPNLNSSISRVNFLATIGCAVFVASVLMVGAMIFAKARNHTKYLFVGAASPLILIGILTQNLVQLNARVAWQEQKTIYNDLFAAVPDLADRTTIVLVLPGYGDRVGEWDLWRRQPLANFWSVSRAIQLFYDNDTLSGDVIYPDLDVFPAPTLTPHGIVNSVNGTLTPYAQAVFLAYDAGAGSFRPLAELPGELVEGASGPIALANDRILSTRPADVSWRRLVAE